MSGSDEEYEQATAEQKLNIANYFVMSSPIGEDKDVRIDVAKIVNDPSVLDDTAVNRMMKEYNTDQLYAAKAPDGKQVIVSKYGQVSDNEYLDPASGKVLLFDHSNQTFKGETDKKQSLSENIAAYRSAIDESMAEYISGQFKKDKAVTTVYGADDGAITICLSAKNVNLSSYWTGGWKTVFTLNVSSKGSVEMKGSTKVHVHYFEDGNVQLHGVIEKTYQVDVSDAAATAESVGAAIGKHESAYQNHLEEMYVDMHRSTFKSMRRFLPITKQMMNWSVYAHNILDKE